MCGLSNKERYGNKNELSLNNQNKFEIVFEIIKMCELLK